MTILQQSIERLRSKGGAYYHEAYNDIQNVCSAAEQAEARVKELEQQNKMLRYEIARLTSAVQSDGAYLLAALVRLKEAGIEFGSKELIEKVTKIDKLKQSESERIEAVRRMERAEQAADFQRLNEL